MDRLHHSAPALSPIPRLRRLGLILVTGKGGVGKTAVSVALGQRLAHEGARVLVLEIDPRESAHHLLGLPPSSGNLLEALPGLFLQNLQPRRVIDAMVRDHVRIGPLVRRITMSPIYEHFVAGCPGLEELVLLGDAQRRLDPPKGATPFDLVILDAPATGHGLALLAAPRLVSDVIEKGPFGRLAADVATFVGNPERCGVITVSQCGELPVQETLELCAALQTEHGRRPELVVANGMYPPLPEDLVADDLDGQRWRTRREANERGLERLRSADPGPVLELPWLPIDDGPQLTARLAEVL